MSPAHVLSFNSKDMIDLPITKRLELVRTPRHNLPQWLATIRWIGALIAMMRNDAMPRGCRAAEPYQHHLDPTYTLTQMHAYRLRELFTDIRSEILSDLV